MSEMTGFANSPRAGKITRAKGRIGVEGVNLFLNHPFIRWENWRNLKGAGGQASERGGKKSED